MKTTPIRSSAICLLASLVLVAFGCGCAAEKEEAKAEAKPHLAGELHFAGERLRVAPFVMRAAEMDLFVACRLAREAREQDGEEAGELCYESTKRQGFSLVRIEEQPEATVATLMPRLSTTNEGAHFLIERTGTIYQILDMAYAVRRGGQVRQDEVRVLSGSKEASENLLKMLGSHFTDFKVKRVTLGTDTRGKKQGGEEP